MMTQLGFLRLATLVVVAAALLSACSSSPTGRRQIKLYSEEKVSEMGKQSFEQLKRQTQPSTDSNLNRYVNCVADAITDQLEGEDKTGNWEVVVFNDDAANAFALPGRKIGVYTGLLKVADNSDQLGAVLGHEVAHVLAQHANERLSTTAVTDVGVTTAQILGGVAAGVNPQVLGLLGAGAAAGVLLPFNRKQESEADLIGLDMMAKAGFDPRQSLALWRNMSRRGGSAGGTRPPEFLSTHPSHDTRMQDLDEQMDAAMQLFEQARLAGRRPSCTRY